MPAEPDRQNSSFTQTSYDRHSSHYADRLANGTLETSPMYDETDSIFRWKYTNVTRSLDPFLNVCPGAEWLTVGDGRYGSEAHYIESKGGQALATDITDDLLKIAAEKGHISRYAKANAEALPFESESFDFTCCKESAHHFPRPMLAIHEMLRVARKAVVIMEPADPYACLRQIEVPLTRVRSLLNRCLTGRNQRDGFEAVGNYLYRFSVREIEKLAIGVGMHSLAYKNLNDFHCIPICQESGQKTQRWRLFLIRMLIRIQDFFSTLGLLQPVMYSIVVFKTDPGQTLRKAMKKEGYHFHLFPENPYFKKASNKTEAVSLSS